ncbi:Uncharacterized protein Adt_23769 [Abeliophyllum distichum]|uniref:Uncharacterized protein n=1 Tax=Abeliophyllum distichum TaxID=126358 RepID=A0ABD1SF27_9LAMI
MQSPREAELSCLEFHVKRLSVDKETASSKERKTNSEKAVEKKNLSTRLYSITCLMSLQFHFLQRLRKHKLDQQFKKFFEVFKKLQINIPFADTLAQILSYAKFMKEILSNKRKLEEHETVMLTEGIQCYLAKQATSKIKRSREF